MPRNSASAFCPNSRIPHSNHWRPNLTRSRPRPGRYDSHRKSPRTPQGRQRIRRSELWAVGRLAQGARRHRECATPLPGTEHAGHSSDQLLVPQRGHLPRRDVETYRLVEIAREVFAASPGVEVAVLDLSRLASEYGRHIHPCKACFSTAAALCHWPCSCYPNYSLGQTQDWINDIYPLWVVAHGMMIVTPVNWCHASSPLMMDRLVCADGGNPDPTRTQGKNAELAKQIELEGWDYPRHLSGRLFSVVVHGDVEGAEKSGAAFPTGCALWIFVPPDLPPRRPLHRLLEALRH